MITPLLNFQSKLSLYEQLYKFIVNEIQSGSLGSEEKLPSKRALAAHLKISPVTVETAYSQLLAEGYIRSVPKSGYFVLPIEAVAPSAPSSQILKEPEEKPPYLYDFKTSLVETESFPFSIWAKLTREVLSEQNNEILHPSHPQGLLLLREEIARHLHRFRGIDVQPSQIVVGAASEYLLTLVCELLGRDKIYGVENPGYKKVNTILSTSDIQTVPVQTGLKGILPGTLENTPADILHVTPSHHFPLGAVMPVSERTRLLNWANASDSRYILEDDYDSEFRFTGRPIPALKSLDRSGKVLYFNTFSKTIAPALRIGYVVLPPALVPLYRERFSAYSCTVSRFEQHILYRFMAGGYFERHIRRTRTFYKTRRDLLLRRLCGGSLATRTQIYGQNAGLHFLVHIKGKTEQELVQSAAGNGVRVYGLSEYLSFPSETLPSGMVVMGYAGFPAQSVEDAVSKLEKAWL